MKPKGSVLRHKELHNVYIQLIIQFPPTLYSLPYKIIKIVLSASRLVVSVRVVRRIQLVRRWWRFASRYNFHSGFNNSILRLPHVGQNLSVGLLSCLRQARTNNKVSTDVIRGLHDLRNFWLPLKVSCYQIRPDTGWEPKPYTIQNRNIYSCNMISNQHSSNRLKRGQGLEVNLPSITFSQYLRIVGY